MDKGFIFIYFILLLKKKNTLLKISQTTQFWHFVTPCVVKTPNIFLQKLMMSVQAFSANTEILLYANAANEVVVQQQLH